MVKRISALLLFLFTVAACCVHAQEAQQAAMERIRGNAAYRWGEARSASQDEAKEKAREDLVSKLSTTLVVESSVETKGGEENFREKLTAITVSTIENLGEISYQDGNEWVCMLYVSAEDLERAETERRSCIEQFIELGQQQEGILNISEALKYYTWALRMLNLYNDPVEVTLNHQKRPAKVWLNAHIPVMLDKIELSLSDDSIEESPSDYDRYLVNVRATYAGQPVSMLDLGYFNGEREVSPVHCKSGEGTLSFHDLSNFKSIDLRVLFDYAAEGRNYTPALSVAYPKGFKRMAFADRAGKKIPVPTESASETPTPTDTLPAPPVPPETAASGETIDTAPLIKQPKRTIERNFEENALAYTAAMQAVEKAIRTKSYQSVRDYFTDEGFKIFELMMGSGTVSVVKRMPDYRVERSDNFIVGKSIPVAVKNGKHISRENIVFRFDGESGKIKSLAYALTERAENDIFREAQWEMNSRYSLLQFMEDYQTAYALKRLDYIERIFSDNAIIIVGTVQPKNRKRFYEKIPVAKKESSKVPTVESGVWYTSYQKDEYLRKLKEDFRKKTYIQLVFEDTQISKVSGTGLGEWVNNEVLWVELKQQYYSSNYSDKGYLALQINLRPSGSIINVRTWTPHFVPLNELKKSFPIGND